MILVVGSTGQVGHEVSLRLLARGEKVRALIRTTSNADKVAALREAGAELHLGDLKDPASLTAACHGAEAVISTASSTFARQPGDSITTVDSEGQLHLVKAAHQAAVKRFVFVSFRRPEGLIVPLAEAKREVEEAIANMNFTILRASYFMESWLSPVLGFDYLNGTARLFGPGTNPISWISSADVAEMCAVALRHPAAERAAIDLGGPEALSPLEVISLFEQVSGKRFQREHIPVDILMAQFQSATDPLQKSFAALGLGFAHGDAMDMAITQRTFGLHLTSVEQYARRVLAR